MRNFLAIILISTLLLTTLSVRSNDQGEMINGLIFLDDQTQSEYILQQDYLPPLLGGWQKLNTEDPKGITLEIDGMIKNKFLVINNQKNIKLVKAEKQVVYGWNYHFVYQSKKDIKNDNGTIHKISSTYQFFCYQHPEQNTANSLIQTYEVKVITTDQQNNIIYQSAASVSGDDLNTQNVPDLQNINKKQEENLFEKIEQQQI